MGTLRASIEAKTCRSLLLAWSLGWILLPTSVAEATSPDLFGFGSRSMSMGMTGVSFADDYEALYSNPAGLARIRESGLFLGLSAASFELELDGSPHYLEAARATTLGFQLPIPFGGSLRDMLVFGGGFYTPLGVVLRSDVLFADEAQWPILARAQSVSIILGLGVDLHRWIPGLHLGLGVNAMAGVHGRLLVEFEDGNRFVSQTETQLLSRFDPILGVAYDRGDLSFGLTYHREVRSEIRLDVQTESLPVELPTFAITAVAQYDPHILSAEASWRARAGTLLSLGLHWRMWSLWPGMLEQTTASSYQPPSPAFHDTFSPRLGVEQTFSRRGTSLRLRGGYAYEPTAAPPARMAQALDSRGEPRIDPATGEPSRTPIRYLDSDRHVLTLGIGFEHRLPEARLFLDAHAQLHWIVARDHELPAAGATTNMQSRGLIPAFGWTGGLEW
ncbi:MAG: hypothetical protein OEY14_04465 [Myxococcales bacterium]|nr:hypothetical protein [Myxococcales bacterium]